MPKKLPQKILIFINNKATILLVKDYTNLKRSKYINLRNYYYREKYNQGEISIKYINIANQLTNTLTKLKLENAIL